MDPAPWNEKTSEWKRKPFLVKRIPQLFHVPLPGAYAKAIGSLYAEAQEHGIACDQKDFFMLTRDISAWKAEILLGVSESKAGLDMHDLDGTFVSKVFDGPFNKIPAYLEEMKAFLNKEGKSARDCYFWYPYCPKCAQKYGHNWIIIFAQV